MLRRAARVLVCQRPHQHARVGLGHLVGHGIDERQQRTHMRTLALVDGGALLAVTPGLVLGEGVILADRDVLDLRMLIQFLEHLLGHDPQDLGVRQARQRAVDALQLAHPIDKGEVLRMIPAVFLDREVTMKRMVDQRDARPAAQFLPHLKGVVPQPNGESLVLLVLAVVAVAIGQRRMVEAIHRPDHAPLADPRDVRVIVRQEPDTNVVFQEGIYAVERPPRPPAGDGDVAVADDDPQILRAEALDVEADVGGLHGLALANEDMMIRPLRGRDDGQLHARGLGEEPLEFLSGVSFCRDRLLSDDDVPSVHRRQIHPLQTA